MGLMDLKNQFKEWWEKNDYRGRDYCVANCPINGLTPYFIQKFLKEFHEDDCEVTEYNTRLAGKVQKLQDSNRIERKAFRENIRISNALEEYNKNLIEQFTNLKPITMVHNIDKT